MIIDKKIETLEHSSVRLTLTIAKEAVNKEYKELLNKYSKTAHIKGFRKGKAPASILEQKFGISLREEASLNLMQNGFKDAYDGIDKKPLAYNPPIIEESDEKNIINLNEDFTYSIIYDIMPEVKVGNYEGLEIEVPILKISKKDINGALEEIRRRNTTVMEKTDGQIEENDIVNIDYTLLDENDNEIDDERSEDFVFTVGLKQNLYQIDDNIRGMKVGEEKVIVKEYPEDFKNRWLAGKKKKIKVKINSIKAQDIPELDDDLAQDISDEFETFEDLKKSVENELNQKVENIIEKEKKTALEDKLLETTEIDLPESMIKNRQEALWRDLMAQNRMDEVHLLNALEIRGKDKNTLFEEWRAGAEKYVKIQLIIGQLIEEKKIEITPEDIEEMIKKQAELLNMEYDVAKERFEQNDLMGYIEEEISYNKFYELLKKSAIIKQVKRKDYLDSKKENS